MKPQDGTCSLRVFDYNVQQPVMPLHSENEIRSKSDGRAAGSNFLSKPVTKHTFPKDGWMETRARTGDFRSVRSGMRVLRASAIWATMAAGSCPGTWMRPSSLICAVPKLAGN